MKGNVEDQRELITELRRQPGIGTLHGVAHPAPQFKAAMRVLHGLGTSIPLAQATDDVLAIMGLAKVLEESLAESRQPDGSVDYTVQAAHVLRVIRRNQK